MKTKLIASIIALSFASPFAMASLSTQDKVDEIIEMVNAHPEVVDNLHQSLLAFTNKGALTDQVMAENHDYLFKNPNHTWFGAENGETVILNFTDYSCPFCKRLDPVLLELTSKYPDDVKIINIYVPLREGVKSNSSAVLALNAWKNNPDKYEEAHTMLIRKSGQHDSKSLNQVAKKLGIEGDLTQNAQTIQMLQKNYEIFMKMGMRGTPAMMVGSEMVEGYLPLQSLEPVVKSQLK